MSESPQILLNAERSVHAGARSTRASSAASEAAAPAARAAAEAAATSAGAAGSGRGRTAGAAGANRPLEEITYYGAAATLLILVATGLGIWFETILC